MYSEMCDNIENGCFETVLLVFHTFIGCCPFCVVSKTPLAEVHHYYTCLHFSVKSMQKVHK